MLTVRMLFFCALLLAALPAAASDYLRVATTLPDLADWVRQIGGDRVRVVSLLKGTEDPHTFEPRVSDVKTLAGSRVLIKVGLGLEEWLDDLVENARNNELLIVDAGEGLADTDHRHDQEHGHAAGNPHVWLDPARALRMCERIAQGLEIADPFGGTFFQERLAGYKQRLNAAAAALRAQVKGLPDRRFVSYHPAWPYFANALGFEIAAVVTRIPGQEPSARRLAELVRQIRSEKIRVVATEPQLPSEIPELLHQETGVRIVTLSPILGAGLAGDYLAQMEANARVLIQALQDPGQ